MDLKQIKELMTAMEKGGLKKIRIKEEKGFEVELERMPEHAPVPPPSFRPEPHAHITPSAAPPPRPVAEEQKGNFITSPMVGTYYAASSPDDPAFVKVGDQIEEETIVCIIEAMKVMNEVKAGVKGRVAEILVDNAHPVEFGTKIIRSN